MIQRGLLTLACVVPLAAFGGAYRWFTLPLVALTALALLANARTALSASRGQRSLDAALIVGCALIAVQLIPLPLWIVELVSPATPRVRGTLRLDAPIAGADWQSISIDPQATLHALGVAASGVLAFFAARGLFSRGGIRRWCRTLSAVGLVVSLTAVAQRALSPNLIYGFWAPLDPNGRPFGPFVNRNHFAAWLLMAGFVVAGYAFAHARLHIGDGPRHIRRTIGAVAVAGTQIYVTAALVMFVTVVLTLSRSALVGLVAGGLTAGLVARRRVRVGAIAQASFASAAVLIGTVLAAGFVDSARVAARVGDTMRAAPESRMVIWRESLPLVRDFWMAGAGAGAYGDAMLVYERADSPVHFNQAHSHYVQVAAEGGVLLLVPWAIAALLFARYAKAVVAADGSDVFYVRVAALCGVAAIAVQSIWETPLRMGANAALFGVLAGIILHRRVRH